MAKRTCKISTAGDQRWTFVFANFIGYQSGLWRNRLLNACFCRLTVQLCLLRFSHLLNSLQSIMMIIYFGQYQVMQSTPAMTANMRSCFQPIRNKLSWITITRVFPRFVLVAPNSDWLTEFVECASGLLWLTKRDYGLVYIEEEIVAQRRLIHGNNYLWWGIILGNCTWRIRRKSQK